MNATLPGYSLLCRLARCFLPVSLVSDAPLYAISLLFEIFPHFHRRPSLYITRVGRSNEREQAKQRPAFPVIYRFAVLTKHVLVTSR